MNRNAIRMLLIVALAVLPVVNRTRGGPNDSQPIGPTPHVVVHAPGTISHTATTVRIWTHPHNMSDFGDYLLLNKNGAQVAISKSNHTVTSVGEGQWDVYEDVSLAGLNLHAGDTLVWSNDVTNYDDWCDYVGTASSTVN